MAATVEELARAEGKVVFHSSMNTEQVQPLVDAFAKKYPYVKPFFYRANGDHLIQRILTETQAGHYSADTVSSGEFRIQVLKERGLTTYYVPDDSSFYGDGFKDPEGHWTSVLTIPSSMAYNTRLVSASAAPKRYEDLLYPKWKGKIGVNPRYGEWYVSLQRRVGKEKARDFLKKLSAQEPGLHAPSSLLTQLLGAGEFEVAASVHAHTIARQKEKGAPIDLVFDEPVITFLHLIALLKNAPHPNAGKLFINFVLSKEGQTLLRERGAIPARRDVDNKIFNLKKLRLFPSDPKWANEYEAALLEMRAIFGGR